MDFSLTSFDDTSYQKGYMEGINDLKATLQSQCIDAGQPEAMSLIDDIVNRTVQTHIHG